MSDVAPQPTNWPTRKWWAALIVGIGTIATATVIAGEWTAQTTAVAIGLVVERAVAWLTPNAAPPDIEVTL